MNENIYQLQSINQRLELHAPAEKKFAPLCVDFTQGKMRHRLQFPGSELLAKAVGFKKATPPFVLDATAGLGNDSFLLASLGCQVTLIERSATLFALLEDGLQRAAQDALCAPIVARMQLLAGNAIELIPQLTPDVIYLDPMYPERNKSALVKKELRILRDIVGDDPDSAQLLPVALQHAKQRVVVKRARYAPTLTAQKPDIIFTGTAVRFDVYLTKL